MRLWKCQAAAAATQASFVVGSVFLKSSLKYVDEDKGEAFSPIVYALAREATAGPILLLLSWLIAGAGRARGRGAAAPAASWGDERALRHAGQRRGRGLSRCQLPHLRGSPAAAAPLRQRFRRPSCVP